MNNETNNETNLGQLEYLNIMLHEIMPPLMLMENVSIDEAIANPDGVGLCLENYVCGGYRCLLGWTVLHPAYKKFVEYRGDGDPAYWGNDEEEKYVDWDATEDAIQKAMGIWDTTNFLFNDFEFGGTMEYRANFIESTIYMKDREWN